MALLAYDLAADGTAKFRKMLVDYAPQDGPDGLVVRQGRQPLRRGARRDQAGDLRLFARGKELAYIKTEVPTNVGFGRGAESETLYITAGKSLYRIRLSKGRLSPACENTGAMS